MGKRHEYSIPGPALHCDRTSRLLGSLDGEKRKSHIVVETVWRGSFEGCSIYEADVLERKERLWCFAVFAMPLGHGQWWEIGLDG